jgi:hypothetical protein
VGHLTTARADELHEASHIVQCSLRSKPAYLRERLPTDRTCALKVALLGVGAGEDGVTLDASPQVRGMAELDGLDRELLSLTGAIEVAEATCKVPCEPALIEVDPGRVFPRA